MQCCLVFLAITHLHFKFPEFVSTWCFLYTFSIAQCSHICTSNNLLVSSGVVYYSLHRMFTHLFCRCSVVWCSAMLFGVSFTHLHFNFQNLLVSTGVVYCSLHWMYTHLFYRRCSVVWCSAMLFGVSFTHLHFNFHNLLVSSRVVYYSLHRMFTHLFCRRCVWFGVVQCCLVFLLRMPHDRRKFPHCSTLCWWAILNELAYLVH